MLVDLKTYNGRNEGWFYHTHENQRDMRGNKT